MLISDHIEANIKANTHNYVMNSVDNDIEYQGSEMIGGSLDSP